ncbi:MAG TPA: molybdate ABC transporter substrate-binding protein [Candidatus Polarisedimenticolaceae bacterium]|nr:molybdate ABC transporter substrate-binding protein [Candidatus Polarisedimenticolaceae bacterium]
MFRRGIGAGLAAALLSLPCFAADVEIVVSAAASLQNAFAEVGQRFEAEHPGTKLVFNFGASGQLVQQIVSGAPADVLATADVDTMDRAEQKQRIVPATRVNFAANALVLVVPAPGPTAVSSLEALNGGSIQRIALGTPPSVPAGQYAKEALELAGLWEALEPRFVFGQNVRQVLDYVARGEVDAGFVYATDARPMQDRVKVVAVLQAKRPIRYPIAVVQGSGQEPAARRFIEFVRSAAGQAILARHGFAPP